MQGFLFSPALPAPELEKRYFSELENAAAEQGAEQSEPAAAIARAAAR